MFTSILERALAEYHAGNPWAWYNLPIFRDTLRIKNPYPKPEVKRCNHDIPPTSKEIQHGLEAVDQALSYSCPKCADRGKKGIVFPDWRNFTPLIRGQRYSLGVVIVHLCSTCCFYKLTPKREAKLKYMVRKYEEERLAIATTAKEGT